jgi:hypothetical protein
MYRTPLIGLTLALGFATPALAGGPPPVYVIVDRVEIEPALTAPERIRIAGSFIRLEDDGHRYGKPVEGFVYLGIGADPAAAKAEWEKWSKAAGTGKVVAVGSCHLAGTMLTATIHKPTDRPTKPDANYTPDFLEKFGQFYAAGDLLKEKPVQDLVKFAKERRTARTAAAGSSNR